MSRFSSIDGQHSALRDLERQRLEKLMGQLRREVEPKADKVGRRFQPPGRRKERPAKPAAVLDPGPGGPATPGGPGTPGGRLGSGGAPTPKEPKPPAATVPSAEMAWLLRVSERFDEEAREVHSFLVQHGLDQFAPLLANGPGAPGASLEALHSASEELLEEAGLPASPRRHLLQALKGSAVQEDAPEPGATFSVSPTDCQHWGRLGHLPSGWHRCSRGEQRPHCPTLPAPVAHADAAVGDDSPLPLLEEDVKVGTPQVAERRPPSSRASSKLAQAEPARPDRALEHRSSTSSAQKGCCYQCFRQVYVASAFHLEPEEERQEQTSQASRPGTPSSQRIFCSSDCVERFRQVLASRSARAVELCKLRQVVESSAALEAAAQHDDRISVDA
ncbi:unnamed protein product [Symbiodinium sp. CCMP2456]|nr:unnamed protein product [Symbiodinium sp. CCMP2456]